MTDFAPLREWMRQTGAAGTVFVPEDAEAYYDNLREDDPELPEWDDIADIVLGTWEWRKGISEMLSERGFEMFDGMFNDVLTAIRGSATYPNLP